MVMSRVGRLIGVTVAGVAALLVIPLAPASAQAQEAGTETTQTAFGPLTPADRDVLLNVRRAGLWEGPTGSMAGQRGASARVREIGPIIAQQHSVLDEDVRAVAKQLGVGLPNDPNAKQQGWISEMRTASSSTQFDQVFVNRLRAAHGKILPVLAENYAGTRNEVMRAFIKRAITAVSGHIEMLESTGLVDRNALPPAPAPESSNQSSSVTQSASTGMGPMGGVVVVVLFVVGVLGTIGLLRVLRS